MDKQKQIEEMASLIYDNRPIKDIWNEEAEDIAKTLYNAGYRKIPEGAVVLTREEYNRLLGQYKNLEINYNCVWEDFRRYEIENEVLKQNIVVLRKETAEKFAERLKNAFWHNKKPLSVDTLIDEICKEITEGKE